MGAKLACEGNDRLIRARNGGPNELGSLLDEYRPYLRALAEQRIGAQFRRRFDITDVVQETIVEGWLGFSSFRGQSRAEFTVWLRRILIRNILNLFRDNLAAKREITRECSLADCGTSETTTAWDLPETRIQGPGQGVMAKESAKRLERVLDSLPASQRQAVILRHLEGWPLREIAEHLDRTTIATAGLIKRGLQNLRKRMNRQAWLN